MKKVYDIHYIYLSIYLSIYQSIYLSTISASNIFIRTFNIYEQWIAKCLLAYVLSYFSFLIL